MADIVGDIKELFVLYPPWLVWACLAIVAAGVGWAVWRLVKFSMVLIITALLIGAAAFAGWMMFGA